MQPLARFEAKPKSGAINGRFALPRSYTPVTWLFKTKEWDYHNGYRLSSLL
ncbi:MAG: hypothetical protein GY874_18895 [Desulfobacteraceae bacterium]|nr:hypothetical protein [Desulfobacteraceae bacterium]